MKKYVSSTLWVSSNRLFHIQVVELEIFLIRLEEE